MSKQPAPTEEEVKKALQEQRLPISQVVDLMYEGHAGEPGMRDLLVGAMQTYDRNGDHKLNAADVDPEDSDTEMLASYDLDLDALAAGMRARIDSYAQRFDLNADKHFNMQEMTQFVAGLTERLVSAENNAEFEKEPRTTQEALDAFEATLNHGLPALPKSDSQQR